MIWAESAEEIGDDWPLSYDQLKPFYELNEAQMGVAGLAGDPAYPDIKELLRRSPLASRHTMAKAFNSLGGIGGRAIRRSVPMPEMAMPVSISDPAILAAHRARNRVLTSHMASARNLGATIITEAAVSGSYRRQKAVGVEYFDKAGEVHHLLQSASFYGKCHWNTAYPTQFNQCTIPQRSWQ